MLIKVFYSRYIIDSSDIRFSDNLIWCIHCIACSWLENQSYCINNTQLSKDNYTEKKKQILEDKERYHDYIQWVTVQWSNVWSTDVTGNFCQECQEVEDGYNCYQVIRGRNCILAGGPSSKEDLYDVFSVGAWPSSNDFYAVCGAGIWSNHIYCSADMVTCDHVFYSINLENCSYCLWCVWLKNKSFCILNKQYTKEERHEKVDEIFTQMETNGILWDFFPAWMNPFYFNDTAASLIEEYSKEEITKEGYLRRDEEIKVDIPDWMEVVGVSELGKYEWRKDSPHPSGTPLKEGGIVASWDGAVETRHGVSVQERFIDPAILKKVIKDEEGNVYRVIKMEYDFLLMHGLPLPREHRLTRLQGHFSSQ